MKQKPIDPLSPQTRLSHRGKRVEFQGGATVNPSVVRASTVLFDTVAQQREINSLRQSERVFTYGVRGTPTNFALEDVISDMEGAFRTALFPTGLSAIAMTFLAFLSPGDHVLIADSVYEPTRKFAHQFLDRYQIQYSFFSPEGLDIPDKLQANTRMILAECPGSLVYEMCDLPMIASIAREHDIWLAVDNTWGSGYQYRPLALGADISIMAATKYLCGHADVMMGTVATTKEAWKQLEACTGAFGMTVSPDDAYLVLRGVRSMAARLAMHHAHAESILQWLQTRPEIETLFSPMLPSHPGHDIWLRDFEGGNGLLSFEMKPEYDDLAAQRFADQLKLFGIGMSWGGYESLVTITNMQAARSLSDWSSRGPIIRLHIGLESPQDLIRDLEQGFAAL